MRIGRAAWKTDTGRRRMRNEDAYVFEPPLFAIADGMGGARAGEVAAGIAAAALRDERLGVVDEASLEATIAEANRRVWERSVADPSTAGMGTTVTVALVDAPAAQIVFGQVGDSRAYRLRGDVLEQVTTDHSLVAELVESGVLTPEEAERHPQRSAITRAVGTERAIEVDVFTTPAELDDLVLLCSDGLTDMLTKDEIAAVIVGAERDPDAAAAALVAAANAHGGEDNITVVLFEVVDGEPDPLPAASERSEAGSDPEDMGQTPSQDEPAQVRTHGAGPGGRLGAIALVALVLVLGSPRPVLGHQSVNARRRELFGLVLAGLIASVALATVTLARDAALSPDVLVWGALFLVLYVVAHVVVRRTAPYADGALLPLTAVLTAFGVITIYRLDSDDGGRQAVWVAVGVAALAATLTWLRHDYRALESYRYLFGVTAIALLLLPSVPGIGQTVNGARLWVDLGVIQFQPGELAKIFLILFLAGYLREKRESLARWQLKDIGPLLAIWGAAMLVILVTNDLGSALLNFGIFLAMLYVATGRALFVAIGLALFVGGAAVLYNAIDHVQDRITIWLQPWTDERVYCSLNGELELRQDCASYQLVKSLYSIANGGFGGTGLGQGTFTSVDGSQLIPYLRTDFIFSAIAQELGLIGAAALLLVFMLFVVRGMRVALQADDGFSKLLAAGLTFGFALQTFIIVGGVLRVVPLTGITLPFVSYGGTSVVANFILLALLLLVSNRANQPR